MRGFFSYLTTELNRGYMLEQNSARLDERRLRVYKFLSVPRELEKFLLFGMLQCCDVFLFMATLLPVRCAIALYRALTVLVASCFRAPDMQHNTKRLTSSQLCDLCRLIILVSCSMTFHYFVDFSWWYHIIRGQGFIKLYLFYNMLEVGDRLLSSFGQDILDAMFWTAMEPRRKKREHIGLVPHLAIAIIYVLLHAYLVLIQASVINVAFNSHSKALLTIMMSNNFVELKGAVFKRFEKNNLFQMSCADARERFHWLLLLGIVSMRNLAEFAWNVDHLLTLVPDAIMVVVTEVLVDWFKHAFITKFNALPATVYAEYEMTVAKDILNSKQPNACFDYVDLISQRFGFTPIPLTVLFIKVLIQSVSIRSAVAVLNLLLLFVWLFMVKFLLHMVLLLRAIRVRGRHDDDQPTTAPAAAATVASDRLASASVASGLSDLDRATPLVRADARRMSFPLSVDPALPQAPCSRCHQCRSFLFSPPTSTPFLSPALPPSASSVAAEPRLTSNLSLNVLAGSYLSSDTDARADFMPIDRQLKMEPFSVASGLSNFSIGGLALSGGGDEKPPSAKAADGARGWSSHRRELDLVDFRPAKRMQNSHFGSATLPRKGRRRFLSRSVENLPSILEISAVEPSGSTEAAKSSGDAERPSRSPCRNPAARRLVQRGSSLTQPDVLDPMTFHTDEATQQAVALNTEPIDPMSFAPRSAAALNQRRDAHLDTVDRFSMCSGAIP